MKFSIKQRIKEDLINLYRLKEEEVPGLIAECIGNDSYKEVLEKAFDVNPDKVCEYDGWHNLTGTGKIEVYRYEKDGEVRFFSDFCYRISIDDFMVTNYVFDHIPSEEEIMNLHDNVLIPKHRRDAKTP